MARKKDEERKGPDHYAALSLRNEEQGCPDQEVFDADIKLTTRHMAFVDAYLGPARFDGKMAARLAGYKPTENNLSVIACVLLKRDDVKAVIAERTRRNAMDADEALSHLADIARGSMSDFMDEEAAKKGVFQLDVRKATEGGKLHLIKKAKMDAEGGIQLELYNKLEALVIIVKQLGLLRDRVDVGITLDAVLGQLPDGLRESVGRQLAQRVLTGPDPRKHERKALPPRGESQ